ncbi:MAG: site-specific integrase, partial [Pirellulales bacterium]
MPKLSSGMPKYRKHKATDQAVVTIAGRDHYLGPHGTKASKVEYDRLIGEWLTSGRPSRGFGQADALTIVELIRAYWRFVRQYYRKNGKPSGEQGAIRVSIHLVKERYGKLGVSEFGPLALKAIRDEMIVAGAARTSINTNVRRIVRMFKWGVSEELV